MRQGLSLRMVASMTAFLALLPLATAPLVAAGVADGSIGATSRGAVLISVSVAPRIRIGHDPAVEPALAGGGERFCLSSNDHGAYRVRVADERGGADGAPLPISLEMPDEGGLAGAGPDRVGSVSLGRAAPLPLALTACASRSVIVRAANLRGNRGGPLLLLIAPD